MPRSKTDPLAPIDRACHLHEKACARLPQVRHRLCGGTGYRPVCGGLSEPCGGCALGSTSCRGCGEIARTIVRELLGDDRFDDEAVVRRASCSRCPEHMARPSLEPAR